MTEDEQLDFIETSMTDAMTAPAEHVLKWLLYHKWRRAMLWQCGES